MTTDTREDSEVFPGPRSPVGGGDRTREEEDRSSESSVSRVGSGSGVTQSVKGTRYKVTGGSRSRGQDTDRCVTEDRESRRRYGVTRGDGSRRVVCVTGRWEVDRTATTRDDGTSYPHVTRCTGGTNRDTLTTGTSGRIGAVKSDNFRGVSYPSGSNSN